jgi:hypothetical protein
LAKRIFTCAIQQSLSLNSSHNKWIWLDGWWCSSPRLTSLSWFYSSGPGWALIEHSAFILQKMKIRFVHFCAFCFYTPSQDPSESCRTTAWMGLPVLKRTDWDLLIGYESYLYYLRWPRKRSHFIKTWTFWETRKQAKYDKLYNTHRDSVTIPLQTNFIFIHAWILVFPYNASSNYLCYLIFYFALVFCNA